MLGRFFDMIVDGFGWAGRWEMFAAKVFSGKTFWEIVDEYVPSMLVKIFDVIDGFDGDIIRRVIMEKCQYDLTFSMFVVERIPSEFGRVLDIIGRFDGDTQREIFAMRDEESGDTLVDVAGGGYDMSADVRSRLQAMVCAANGQDHIPTNPIFSS
jgi:hypothetical protein